MKKGNIQNRRKLEAGITLVTLVVAVSIMIIMATMLIYNAKNGIDIRKLKYMQNDIELLDNKIDGYYIKYGALPVSIRYNGSIYFEAGPNDNNEYYIIDLSALEGVTLNYGEDYKKITSENDTVNKGDIYIINTQSHHIYYVQGIELDGKRYYTIDSEEEIILKEKWREETDEVGNKIITNGRQKVQIGDYVYYNPVTGATNITYTSYGTQNGYGDQVFRLSSITGEKVSYNTTTYSWKVLGVSEKGELLIVSEDIIQPVSGGTTENGINYYTLTGKEGYTNVINELNKISEIYGQGYAATGARSIKVEDVNKLTGYNPNNVGVYDPEQKYNGTKFVLEGAGIPSSEKVWNEWDEGMTTEYENEMTYYWDGTAYPYYISSNGENGKLGYSHEVFSYYKDEILINLPKSLTATIYNMEKITTLKNTFYLYYSNTLTLDAKGEIKGMKTDSKSFNMLFIDKNGKNKSSYWLASTCILTSDRVTDYCVRSVNNGYITGGGIYYSNSLKTPGYAGIRPVVSLEPYTELSGSSEEGWTILKK